MPKPDKLEKAKQLLGFINDGLTKGDFVKSFANIVAYFKRFETALTQDFRTLAKTLTDRTDAARADLASRLSDALQRIDAKLATVRNGDPGDKGDDGHTPTDDELNALILPLIPAPLYGSPDLAEDIRNKLELLTGAERLDKSAVRGIDDLEKQIGEVKNAPRVVGAGSGFQLLVGGKKKGKQQYLNLIAGAGVTLIYNNAQGRNDITVSATGGSASLAVLAATGTIDDSNTSFTFASTPLLVIVNGVSYRDGHGCTISGTSVTLANPVGVGGDLYAIG